MTFRDRDVRVLGALWVVFSLAGEWLAARAIERWPIVVSEEGRITADAFTFLLRVGVVVFVLVALLIVYSSIRFRARDSHAEPSVGVVASDRPADAPAEPVDARVQRRGHRAFTVAWVAITTLLNLAFIVYPGAVGLGDLARLEREAEAAGPLVVEVTARQWSWSYRYPGYGIDAATELVLPVDRPAKLVMTSPDVIHSFWVPAFGIKKDVVPGQTAILYITPTTIASSESDPRVRAQCAELCGPGHPDMRSSVRILSASDFAAWVDAESGPGATMGPMPGMSMEPGATMGPMPGMSMEPGATMGPMPGMSMEPGATMGPMPGMSMEPGATMGPMPGMSMEPGATMGPMPGMP